MKFKSFTNVSSSLKFYIDGNIMEIIKVVEGYDGATTMKSDLKAIINN